MLDLAARLRTVAGVDLAGDAADPRVFYVLPGSPRVARHQGRPELSLLRFVRDGELTGGHLQLAVDVGHPASRLEEARRQLAEQVSEDDLQLLGLTPRAASAELLFLGRETDADGGLTPLVRHGYGQVAARIDPPHRAHFAVDLEPAGVRAITSALAAGGAPIGVVYRLQVEGLWPALQVVARVDWRRVYDHFSAHERRGALLFVEDIRQLTEQLIEQRVIEIHAVQGLAAADGDEAADPGPALAWIQRELVERFCEPLLPLSREPARASLGGVGEVFGVGAAFAIKSLAQIEHAHAEVDFQRQVVVARTWNAQAHLADLLDGGSPAEYIADADSGHPFFERFALRVESTRPLPELHLDEAVLQFRYGSQEAAARLDATQREAHFEAWRDASPDGTWTVLPTVRFAATAPVQAGAVVPLTPLAGRSREIALDFQALLALRELRLAAPTDERVLACRARVAHWRAEARLADHELVFTPDAPEQVLWFADFRSGDRLEVTPGYLTHEGRMLEGATLAVDTEVFRLPPPYPGTIVVELISDSDWTDLEHVIVAVQKAPDGPTGSFRFDGPDQVVAVRLDLPDPADRRFRYRVTRTWSSGTIEEDDWTTTDASVVVVGRVAADKLVVELAPLGPDLPAAGIRLIEVELAYLDVANRVREQHTAVIQARADRPRWQVALADRQHRTYEYRIIVHRTSGTREVGPWTTTAARILPIPVTPS